MQKLRGAFIKRFNMSKVVYFLKRTVVRAENRADRDEVDLVSDTLRVLWIVIEWTKV